MSLDIDLFMDIDVGTEKPHHVYQLVRKTSSFKVRMKAY